MSYDLPLDIEQGVESPDFETEGDVKKEIKWRPWMI